MAAITVHFHPYTYVRATVMRTKLLSSEDYATMLRMGPQEIIHFLQSKGYTEFAALGAEYAGVDLVERAVQANLVASFRKMQRIADESLRIPIDLYLLRYDVHNLKAVLRGLMFSASVEPLLIPAGSYPLPFYQGMLAKGSLKEALPMLHDTIFSSLAKIPANEATLFRLESQLDALYYAHVFGLIGKLGEESERFKLFIGEEITTRNLITILKIKHLGLDPSEHGLLFRTSGNPLLKKLLAAPTLEDALAVLEHSPYYRHLEQGIIAFKQDGSLIELEKAIRVYLLSRLKASYFLHLLSVDTILTYLFEKDLESKNILLLFKAKTFGMDDDFVKEQLIV